jgi:hypothetical protein
VVIVVVATDMKVGKRGVIPSYSDRHRRKREKINKEREFSSAERESSSSENFPQWKESLQVARNSPSRNELTLV